MREQSQYAQISFTEASLRIFPLRLHIDSPAAEIPLVILPQILVAKTHWLVLTLSGGVWWCIVLPVKHFVTIVGDVDSSSIIHPAAVLDHVSWTKNVSLSDTSLLNTVRSLQLDANVHVFLTHFAFHYWLRHVDRRFKDSVIRVSEPGVGEGVACERVTCSTNISVQSDLPTKRNTFQHKINWNEENYFHVHSPQCLV